MWHSSFGTHTLTCVVHEREREKELWLEKKEDQSFGFYLLSFWGIYIEEAFVGFFPLGFSRINLCCSCDIVSFSDPVYMILL